MQNKFHSRLIWACRRGMLELDVLLSNFLQEVYPSLSATNQQQFVDLLSCKDPDLFAWLMGSEQPANETLIPITEMIKQHARSRLSTKTL